MFSETIAKHKNDDIMFVMPMSVCGLLFSFVIIDIK